ncbi:MAG: hypothetical protein L3J24_04575 [Xanthomonadales bacterium]|nr:hypothetical protein [Xanthomonadales bacterium]
MPTEELFGAYHFSQPTSGEKAQITRKLKAAGMNLSTRGLDQVLRAAVVSNSNDRRVLAKIVGKLAK